MISGDKPFHTSVRCSHRSQNYPLATNILHLSIHLLTRFYIHSIQKKNGRIYKIGHRLIEIHQNVLSELKDCNSGETKEDAGLDNEFAEAVLSSVVAPNEMETGKIYPDAINFVMGNTAYHLIEILVNILPVLDRLYYCYCC